MLSGKETVELISESSKHKATLPLKSVILLSIMAGGAISVGSIFWAHSILGVKEAMGVGVSNFIGGITFSVGLILIVFFGGHLFTGSVMSGVSAFEHKLRFSKMFSYWIIVWFFNLIGAFLVAYLYHRTGIPMATSNGVSDITMANTSSTLIQNLPHAAVAKLYIATAAKKASLPFDAALIRGIFCNIFVCMGVWAGLAAKDTAGKILGIVIIISAFIASGYEHCVANMFIFSEAAFAKSHLLGLLGGDIEGLSNFTKVPIAKLEYISIGGFISNLIPVTIGNIIGGLVVAVGGSLSHNLKEKVTPMTIDGRKEDEITK